MSDAQHKIDRAAQKAFAEAAALHAVINSPKSTAKQAAPKSSVPKSSANLAANKRADKPTKETQMTKAKTAKAANKVKTETAKAPATSKAAVNFTAKLKDGVKVGVADLQTRAKTAYSKGSDVASQASEFTKGNVGAAMESGKILASGTQDMAKAYVTDGKAALETLSQDMKDIAAVKSPSDFLQVQNKIISRNFNDGLAAINKNSAAWMGLANEAYAPLSGRVKLAMEKFSKKAA